MAKKVQAIPEGYHTLTPGLIVQGAARAIEFYRKAFGAEERMRMPAPDGRIMHSELKIGDSIIFVNDEMPDMQCLSPKTLKGSPISLYIYVENVDAAFKRAVEAGATVTMPLADMFWGDRFGKLVDPFGHQWGLATHKEDVAPAEMKKRQEAYFAQMSKQGKP